MDHLVELFRATRRRDCREALKDHLTWHRERDLAWTDALLTDHAQKRGRNYRRGIFRLKRHIKESGTIRRERERAFRVRRVFRKRQPRCTDI